MEKYLISARKNVIYLVRFITRIFKYPVESGTFDHQIYAQSALTLIPPGATEEDEDITGWLDGDIINFFLRLRLNVN